MGAVVSDAMIVMITFATVAGVVVGLRLARPLVERAILRNQLIHAEGILKLAERNRAQAAERLNLARERLAKAKLHRLETT